MSLYFFKIGYVIALVFLLGLVVVFTLNFDRYAVCGLLKSGDEIFNGGGKGEYFEQFGKQGKHSILNDMVKDIQSLDIDHKKILELEKRKFGQKALHLENSF